MNALSQLYDTYLFSVKKSSYLQTNPTATASYQRRKETEHMDSTTLLSKTPLTTTEESLSLVSLYETLQELPDARRAPTARMLALVRAHWAIENRLHWCRDVTLGEDACQTRTGPTPSLLAQLNSTVLSVMDRLGVRTIVRLMRYFDAHLEQALHRLLTGRCLLYLL